MIYIYSSSINSGKTTALSRLNNYLKTRRKLCSFLSIKKEYKSKREYFLYINGEKFSKIVEVVNGKLYYFEKVFELAYKFCFFYPFDFFIIDEAGYLELDKKGFYRIIKYIIDNDKDCVICVRDFLLKDFISFYKIKNYLIVNEIGEIKKCLK